MRLLRLLSETQHRLGYLSAETLHELARAENVPLHRLQQLVSFYPHFRTTPPPRVELQVCRDMSCWLAGGDACEKRFDHLKADDIEVHPVSCLGRCEQAPAAALNGKPIPAHDIEQVARWVSSPETIPETRTGVRTWTCDPYPTPEARYSTLQQKRLLPEARAEAIATLDGQTVATTTAVPLGAVGSAGRMISTRMRFTPGCDGNCETRIRARPSKSLTATASCVLLGINKAGGPSRILYLT